MLEYQIKSRQMLGSMGKTAGTADKGFLLPYRALELPAHLLQVTRVRHSLFTCTCAVFFDVTATEMLGMD